MFKVIFFFEIKFHFTPKLVIIYIMLTNLFFSYGALSPSYVSKCRIVMRGSLSGIHLIKTFYLDTILNINPFTSFSGSSKTISAWMASKKWLKTKRLHPIVLAIGFPVFLLGRCGICRLCWSARFPPLSGGRSGQQFLRLEEWRPFPLPSLGRPSLKNSSPNQSERMKSQCNSYV